MAGIQPDVLTPEEWRQYLLNAQAALHTNPNDAGALAAVKQANKALNQFDQPAIAAGENVGESGFGKLGPALEGLGQSALDIPRGIGRFAKNLVTNPGQIVEDVVNLPEAIGQGFASGDPEQISRTVGNLGGLALPFAKTSKAAGAPTVGALAGRVVSQPFRAVGNLLERPALRNQLLAEQQGLAAARRSLAETRARDILPQQAEQAGLRTELLRNQAQRAPVQTEAALRRIELMEQQLERGGPTLENIQLRNELLRLKLELQSGGEAAALESAPAVAPNLETPAFIRRGGTVRQDVSPISGDKTITGQGTAATRAELLKDPGQIVPNNPLSQLDDTIAAGRAAEGLPPLSEAIENIPGKMGQKTVQFGEGSPLNPAAQSEILGLLGELQRILGKKGGM